MRFPLGTIEEDQPPTLPLSTTNNTTPNFPFVNRSWADGNWENRQPAQSFTYAGVFPAGALRQNGDPNGFSAISGTYDLYTSKPSFNTASCGAAGKPLWVCNNWIDLETTMNDGLKLKDYVRRLHLDRLETLMSLDALVGEIYDKLTSKNLLSQTLIILTSDNGYLLGEFRLGDKSTAFTETSKVPLLIKAPQTATATADQLAANIDLAPTILEYAGLNWQNELYNVDGRSLYSFLLNNGGDSRDFVLLEHRYPRDTVLDKPHKLIPDYTGIQAVRTNGGEDDYLYVLYGEDPTTTDGTDTGFVELYNLQTDPYQVTNLATVAGFVDKKAELEQYRADLTTCVAGNCRTFDTRN